MLAVRPEILDRVKFRRIGWKEFGHQATALRTDKLLSGSATMSRKTIPDHQQLARDITKQVSEEFDHLLGADSILKNPKVKIPEGQPGNDGQRLPIEVELEDGRMAARRPRAPAVRSLAQPAFVEKDDRAAFFLRFFLMAGQRRFFQSSMSASFRSNARPTGC